MPRVFKIIETKRTVVTGVWGGKGTASQCLMSVEFPFGMMKKFWRRRVGRWMVRCY